MAFPKKHKKKRSHDDGGGKKNQKMICENKNESQIFLSFVRILMVTWLVLIYVCLKKFNFSAINFTVDTQ